MIICKEFKHLKGASYILGVKFRIFITWNFGHRPLSNDIICHFDL